jgi:hypothetical protein
MDSGRAEWREGRREKGEGRREEDEWEDGGGGFLFGRSVLGVIDNNRWRTSRR